MKTKKEKLEIVQAVLVALLSLFTGFQNRLQFPFIGIINILLGIILIIGIIAFVKKKAHLNIKAVALATEAFSLLFAAYMYFSNGKQYLPYAFLLAALLCLAGVFIMLKKAKINPGTS
ncbi:hypothetical protein [Zunongwangia sp. H14]|uniref:hypothetical protein n=1 Tax=Zunongwangia sp. H14 TaxID=3240792 RepID=UPI003566F005